MIFLTPKDLETQIFEEFLELDNPEELKTLDILEKQDISYIKSKLRGRFKIDEMFTQTDDDRDPLLVKHLTTLVIFDLLIRNKVRKIPGHFYDMRKETFSWLNDVRNGDETPDFPKVETNSGKQIYHGNATNNQWYI